MFARLIFAHLLGDFVLQTRWLVRRKGTPAGLSIHLGVVGLSMLLVVWDELASWWPWLLLILAVHGVADWAKVRLEPRLRLPPIVPFLVDQVVHLGTIAAVAAAMAMASGDRPDHPAAAWLQGKPAWWVADAYLAATFALSIALPLWLDPPNLMQRPAVARLTIIATSAVVLTLAWQGWPILIPLVGLALYEMVARRLSHSPVTRTFGLEFWSAVILAATVGWGLS